MAKSGRAAVAAVASGVMLMVLAIIPGCGGGGGGSTPVTVDNGQYGSVLNFQEFDTAPHALPAEALLQPPLPPLFWRRCC